MGDLDYVPMQQGEDFVRYWGEGHTIESPPNVLDMWARIFAWLEEHLR